MTPELPLLDLALCVGCGDCAAVCPTFCLAMAGRTPWMPRPRDCVYCGLCVQVCPTDAVRLAEPAAEKI
jgi:NAD-dependent dihydropyrimidine dehydrogenase PreA subunit